MLDLKKTIYGHVRSVFELPNLHTAWIDPLVRVMYRLTQIDYTEVRKV
jgi:hypothetical protein